MKLFILMLAISVQSHANEQGPLPKYEILKSFSFKFIGKKKAARVKDEFSLGWNQHQTPIESEIRIDVDKVKFNEKQGLGVEALVEHAYVIFVPSNVDGSHFSFCVKVPKFNLEEQRNFGHTLASLSWDDAFQLVPQKGWATQFENICSSLKSVGKIKGLKYQGDRQAGIYFAVKNRL